MTGKQKKPIISGNLGAAARDPRDRARERERERRRATSSRDRTNGRRAAQNNAMRRDATHRIARAMQRERSPTTVRLSIGEHPGATARTPTRPSLLSPLVASVGVTCRHDRAPAIICTAGLYIITITNTPLCRGCLRLTTLPLNDDNGNQRLIIINLINLIFLIFPVARVSFRIVSN